MTAWISKMNEMELLTMYKREKFNNMHLKLNERV